MSADDKPEGAAEVEDDPVGGDLHDLAAQAPAAVVHLLEHTAGRAAPYVGQGHRLPAAG